MRKRKRVVVVGGGVAGLSAAHELATRGFDVTVIERNRVLGGKARSVPVPESARGDAEPLPGEHGFRFLPGWYRHLPDTMSRIPDPKRGGTVLDNLVDAEMNLLACYERAPIQAVVRFPRSTDELKLVFKFPKDVLDLVPAPDLEFFMRKMARFVVSCEERRLQEFESQSWWEFMDADNPARSKAFRDYLVEGATRPTVAARAREASAYTVAKMAIQTFLDAVIPGVGNDRVLNAPTQEAWIEPWRVFLEQQGVEFKLGWELDGIEWGTRKEIAAVRVTRTRDELKIAEARSSLIELLRQIEPRPAIGLAIAAAHVADLPESPADRERLRKLAESLGAARGAAAQTEAADELRRALLSTREVADALVPARHDLDEIARTLRAEVDELRARQLKLERVEADYFVFALPVEQMAYFVDRDPTFAHYENPAAKMFSNIVRLSEHVDWMAGIQFYLRSKADITRGHFACLDSEWCLTGISQVQFWDDVDMKERGDGKCKAILSVDISAWDAPGQKHKKAAWDCTVQEIAEEVWDQLERTLNRSGEPPRLSKNMLIGAELVRNRSFFLDDSIVDRYDRKKQGFYEKHRRVAFDARVLVSRQVDRGRTGTVPEAFGPRLQFNAEPLLVNRARSWVLRPTAATDIPNMFLAADYVKTHTNLATMEGANEAAREAVNAILTASGYAGDRCRIWPLPEPPGTALVRAADSELFKRGARFETTGIDIPIRLAGAAGKAALEAAARTTSAAASTFERARRFFRRDA